MNDAQALQNALAQCTGTGTWWRHPLNRNMLHTDGVLCFADNAGGGAHWFLDIVATEIFPKMRDHDFLAITLAVDDNHAACITAYDENADVPLVFERRVEWTDCPAGKWRFFLTDNVLLLPSEY